MARIVSGLGREWLWPEADRECIKVIFDWLGDMKRAVEFCKRRRTCVQAGGNMGVWPFELAKIFKRVHTAEADPECFELLTQNLEGIESITTYPVAFFDAPGKGVLHLEAANRGAQYVQKVSTGPVEFATIDSLGITDCDLIYLDIEGAELNALMGAHETIKRSKPVIAVEDKGLSSRFGTPQFFLEQWLAAEFGYKVVARPHRDVVLTCE